MFTNPANPLFWSSISLLPNSEDVEFLESYKITFKRMVVISTLQLLTVESLELVIVASS